MIKFIFIIFAFFLLIPVSHAELSFEFPDYLQIPTIWWKDGKISDSEYTLMIDFLSNKNIISIPNDSILNSSSHPEWLLNNAGWWAARISTNSDFSSFDNSYINEMIYRCDLSFDEKRLITVDPNNPNPICQEKINNVGFRGDDVLENKPMDVFRIFAVGGSTTFGDGVEDNQTWPIYLQKLFEKYYPETKIEVINAGVGSSTTTIEVKLVQEKKLDFGVAFDGDADRAVFIDDTGKVVSGSMMTTLIADYLSEKKDNLKVVYNVNVSPHALSILDSKNISLHRCKVGHSNIKAMMKELEADFGGEHSAHFYYKDNYFADSAILTLLMFMTIISERGEKVSSMIDKYNFPPSSGEINYVVEDVDSSLEKIKNFFNGDFDELDGLSYFDENFWFNVRGSNTEPKLRVNIEASSQKILDEVLEKISTTI